MVAVDLEPDVLVGEAELVEQRGVRLRREHRRGLGKRVAVGEERITERWLVGDLERERVRRVIAVGRDLDREPSTGAECVAQQAQQAGVVRHPVQRRVAEHEVVRGSGLEPADVAELEAQPRGTRGAEPARASPASCRCRRSWRRPGARGGGRSARRSRSRGRRPARRGASRAPGPPGREGRRRAVTARPRTCRTGPGSRRPAPSCSSCSRHVSNLSSRV